jgi:chromosome segregation ATPase
MQDQMLVLQNENSELKQSLTKLQGTYQELQEDSRFNEVKVSELKEILEVRGTDAVHEKLMYKSLHNAELSLERDRLKMELHQATSCVQKLGEQREETKRMLLELSDIVRTLQSVRVDYDTTKAGESYLTGQAMSLRNVKKKVETIMEDRRMLVTTCKKLETENKDKDEKISALEAQFHLLNSMNIVEGSHEDCDATIGSISRTSSSNSGNEKKNSMHIAKGSDEDCDASMGSISRTSSSNSGFKKTNTKKSEQANTDDMSCVSESSTSPVSEESSVYSVHVSQVNTFEDSAEVERLKGQLTEANHRYQQFKQVCQKAFVRMGDFEAELQEAKRELEATSTKRDAYRSNLRDVINQYKLLHQEYDEGVEKMKSMGEAIKNFEAEKAALEERGAEVLEEEGLADNVDDLIRAYLKAGEKIASLERKVATAEREAKAAEQRKELGNCKLRDAVAKHRKLEQEKEDVQFLVATAEEELHFAKKETQRHKEEAKHTRRRLTAFLRNTELVDLDHEIALLIPEVLETKPQDQHDGNPWSGDVHRKMFLAEASLVGKAWNEKFELVKEKERLTHENGELKEFCEHLLNDAGLSTNSDS